MLFDFVAADRATFAVDVKCARHFRRGDQGGVFRQRPLCQLLFIRSQFGAAITATDHIVAKIAKRNFFISFLRSRPNIKATVPEKTHLDSGIHLFYHSVAI